MQNTLVQWYLTNFQVLNIFWFYSLLFINRSIFDTTIDYVSLLKMELQIWKQNGDE